MKDKKKTRHPRRVPAFWETKYRHIFIAVSFIPTLFPLSFTVQHRSDTPETQDVFDPDFHNSTFFCRSFVVCGAAVSKKQIKRSLIFSTAFSLVCKFPGCWSRRSQLYASGTTPRTHSNHVT